MGHHFSSMLLVPLPPTCCCTLMHLALLVSEGFFLQGQWFQGRFSPLRVGRRPHSRLRTIHGLQGIGSHCCGCGTLGRHWSCKYILFLCDDQAACAILNKGRARCSVIMQLIRHLSVKPACFLSPVHGFKSERCCRQPLTFSDRSLSRACATCRPNTTGGTPRSIIFPWKRQWITS